MDSSEVSRMRMRSIVSYTAHTVRTSHFCYVYVLISPIARRTRSVCSTIGCYELCYSRTMVLPLSDLCWTREYKHRHNNLYIPPEETRWWDCINIPLRWCLFCVATCHLDIMAEAGHAAGEVDNTKENKYKQILGIRTVHLLSVFALIYVGVEVTLGGMSPPILKSLLAWYHETVGWIVTFIQQKRGGGPSAGYISSGFFGGKP